jgi:glutathione S-transferase
MTDQPRLIVLAPSHYCERARWALEHAGLAYREERWAVGLHVRRAKRIAPRSALPILVAGDTVVQGSGAILDWTGLPGGLPDLERRFEERIGVLVRQFIYAAMLGDPASGVREALFDGLDPGEARLAGLLWPVTRRLMALGMNARPALVPRLQREVEGELDWFEGRLGDRAYLDGDGFGRADITAASLLAPLARPAACPLYRRVRWPEGPARTLTAWSARPSLRWAYAVYERHR